jgi:hypothetical protein
MITPTSAVTTKMVVVVPLDRGEANQNRGHARAAERALRRLEVRPKFRIVRVSAPETPNDCPVLTAHLADFADIQSLELPMCAIANDQFTEAGLEEASLDELHLGPHAKPIRLDSAEGDVRADGVAWPRNLGNHDQLPGRDREPVFAPRDGRILAHERGSRT